MALVSFAAFGQLYRTYQENNIHTIKHLSLFFASYGAFQFLIGARIIVEGFIGELVTEWYIIAHLMMYVSLAYTSRLASYLIKPSLEKKLFYGNIVIGVILTGIMVYAGEALTPLIAVPAVINWIGLGTVPFVYLGLKRVGIERYKMLMLGAGFFMIALAGPLHNVATTGLARLSVNLVTVIGAVLAMLGVYLKRLLDPDQL